MNPDPHPIPLIDDELELLSQWVPLADQDIIELGCGAAQLARRLLQGHPGSRVTGVEVDLRQLAINLATPQAGLHFIAGVAQAIPLPPASFDLALMLKSLHHVPVASMAQALAEAGRVLRPGGHLYVSEPVYAGALNDVIRLFNDEGMVRAAAQAAVDEALRSARWEQVAETRFGMTVSFHDFADFEQRMMRPTYAEHHLDETIIAAARAAFEPHLGAGGAQFVRLMHTRVLRRRG